MRWLVLLFCILAAPAQAAPAIIIYDINTGLVKEIALLDFDYQLNLAAYNAKDPSEARIIIDRKTLSTMSSDQLNTLIQGAAQNIGKPGDLAQPGFHKEVSINDIPMEITVGSGNASVIIGTPLQDVGPTIKALPIAPEPSMPADTQLP